MSKNEKWGRQNGSFEDLLITSAWLIEMCYGFTGILMVLRNLCGQPIQILSLYAEYSIVKQNTVIVWTAGSATASVHVRWCLTSTFTEL